MRRPWIIGILASAGAGLALAACTPPRWGVAPVHGLMLGLALYAAAVHGQAEQALAASKRSAVLRGVLVRAAVFLGLWWTQAILCFDVIPDADVRRGFITLSAWVVAQAILGAGAPRRSPAPAR